MKRLELEYEARLHRIPSDEYSLFKMGNLFLHQQRQKATIQLVNELGWKSFGEKSVLEVGCGTGGVLQEYLGYGVKAKRLHGIEYLPDRVRHCHAQMPHVQVIHGDGQTLPYNSACFDVVLQYTVFSSILAPDVRLRMANEMVRVLRPTGTIIWYDFWLNPKNRQTQGMGLDEVKRLFPNARMNIKKITLAPPIARRLAPVSWMVSEFLEKLKFLNSHYLIAISPATA